MSELAPPAKNSLDAAQTRFEQAKTQYEKAKANSKNVKMLYKAALVSTQNAVNLRILGKLCASCKKIDFDALFEDRVKGIKHVSASRRPVGNLYSTIEC